MNLIQYNSNKPSRIFRLKNLYKYLQIMKRKKYIFVIILYNLTSTVTRWNETNL